MKRELPNIEDALRILRSVRTKRLRRPPPPVARQVAPLLKDLNARFQTQDTGAGNLKLRWSEIVGQAMAGLCEPVKITKAKTGAILDIRCEGVYAPLLQHQTSLILSRVNLHLGPNTIGRIRLIQGQITKPKPQAIAPSSPLSAQRELELQASLSNVDNPDIRHALLKLGRAVMKKNSVS
jgi:hypothetical protein